MDQKNWKLVEICKRLKYNDPTLTQLDLGDNRIDSKGAESLAEALKSNTTLTQLNLRVNQIGSKGAESLAEALKSNTTLTQLDLRGNQIGSKGAASLAEALKSNTTLTQLDVINNRIGSEGTKSLAEALKSNTTLTQLDLQNNQIGSEGTKSLAEALKSNTTLIQLNLIDNQIGSKGAESLAEALKSNATLTQLDIIYNQIDSKGAESLAEALKSNTTLVHLNLKNNQIGSKGAESLAEALKSNTTLTHLNLQDNQIDSKGAESLAEALKSNTTLTQLDLSYNQIDSKGAESLAEALKSNTTLTHLNLRANKIDLQLKEKIEGLIKVSQNFLKFRVNQGSIVEINFSELKLGEELGRGGFGVVKRATYKGKQVAVKFIERANNDQEFYDSFRKELEIISILDHPYIVKCLGGCTIAPYCFIVTEYCNRGSLFDLLHERNEKLSTQQQLDFALKIAEGMEYLHTHKPMIVHRDLKSKNILIHDNVPKICDFGLSRTKEFSTQFTTANVGTYNWMAPELMEPGQNHNEKVDVWSYAMVLYEITTNQIPYNHCQNQVQFSREVCDKKQKPTFPIDREIDPTLLKLMQECWNWDDPQKRPSFTQIVQTLRKSTN